MDPILAKFLLSIMLGAAVGLERQVYSHNEKEQDGNENHGFLGMRTFIILMIIGCMSGLLFIKYSLISLMIIIGTVFLLGAHYIFHSTKTKNYGITTELASLITFFIGVIIALDALPYQVIIALTVVIILILNNKEKVRNFIHNVQGNEVSSFSSYALIAFAILPFLPNVSFALKDFPTLVQSLHTFGFTLNSEVLSMELINPFRLWFIVVLITGIDVFGHIIKRIVGSKAGVIASSLIGGFISSTSTTVALAIQSKKYGNAKAYAGAALLANSMSFISTFILLMGVSSHFVIGIFPILFILWFTTFIIGLYFVITSKLPHVEENKDVKQIFSLEPALIFAGLFLLIRFISKIATIMIGETGFLATSAISGIVGIDAAAINIAESFNTQSISLTLAIAAFVALNCVNLWAKIFYSYASGSKEFVKIFALSLSIVTICVIIGFILL